jgi:hypothetical protein
MRINEKAQVQWSSLYMTLVFAIVAALVISLAKTLFKKALK